MTLTTFVAGIVIVCATVLLELNEKMFEDEKNVFEDAD